MNIRHICTYTPHIIMKANEKTTILVQKKTREQLKALGKKENLMMIL